MKLKINKVDFKTWDSWNMPYYTNVLHKFDNGDIKQYHKRKDNTILKLALIVVGLFTAIVLLHWDSIKAFIEKHFNCLKEEQSIEEEQTLKDADSSAEST